jgi:hypothetical protein
MEEDDDDFPPLSAFEKLRKAIIRIVMLVRPSA